MKNFIFRHCLSTASMAKTTIHKVLFLVSMDSQRSKELDGSQFWALECLLTASGWLESIRAIMAPPRVITSFQSSCEIGLNVMIVSCNLKALLTKMLMLDSFMKKRRHSNATFVNPNFSNIIYTFKHIAFLKFTKNFILL